ncbi:D-alanyl-D-alanine carboxypeptidase family protein [Coprococcus sp. CLA-AA-H190]|uniref:serine-type D-Ala-D-Ala carboxypeptidase n=1 Tax=Coprococcus intestinihominis TaxID=3133154 RepID=A0ABV1B1V8_9FIRM
MKNKIIAVILLMGILWNGQMVYAEDTAVGEVIATESENSESTNEETAEMELERESESQGVVSTESAVTVISEAAVLMEAGTGTVIYEKNQDVRVSPASITKIMTLLLIYDALYNGKIQLTDEVVTSARAKSMGGSQVFLEEGEKQTVETLIKCIVIASGNDASVAMAEYVSGSEEAFVGEMNQKAADLGMNGTHFVDCCGLTDSNDHYTTAKDVAIMARTLITNYPDISQYATIWMENITHVTAKGSSEFGLSNTNKLLKMANNFEVTGLKTGSTAKAGYCFCGTAVKDGLSLIAVVMDAPDYKIRFSEAQQLLNYGFANCSAYRDDHPPVLLPMAIKDGKTESVELMYDGQFSYVALRGENLENIHSKLQLDESLSTPFEAGTKAGRLIYYLDDTEIGEVPVVTKEGIQKAGFSDYLEKVYRNFMSICG